MPMAMQYSYADSIHLLIFHGLGVQLGTKAPAIGQHGTAIGPALDHVRRRRVIYSQEEGGMVGGKTHDKHAAAATMT